MNEQRLLSPQTIGRRLDISDKTVIRLILQGRLKGHKIGKLWKISEESYQEYLKQTAYKSQN